MAQASARVLKLVVACAGLKLLVACALAGVLRLMLAQVPASLVMLMLACGTVGTKPWKLGP